MGSQADHSGVLTGASAAYIADLYSRFQDNPSAVDASWASFFRELDDDSRALLLELTGASWGAQAALPDPTDGGYDLLNKAPAPAKAERGPRAPAEAPAPASLRQATLDSVRALMLIRAYRVRGHLLADLDPLGLAPKTEHPELDPASYGFGPEDHDRPIFINNVLGLETATLRQILDILTRTYCGRIGVEFTHIQDPDIKQWIQERIENGNRTDFTVNGKRAILERLTAAESFERFLQLKYTGTKRFGLEGGEALIPALEQIMKRGGQMGLKEIVLGMAHRGRLNVLANVMGKPFRAIFSEFQGNPAQPEDVQGSGDVKYHLGTSSDRDFDGNPIHLSLTANPSHLEAVNPVVVGKVRAKQDMRDRAGEDGTVAVMGVLLHGDAAFAGQGLVPETLTLSELKGYEVGGTIHIIINNQIGFTTTPSYARSGPYPTDVAKSIQAPIFHVNGDDPEAVVHVARIATEFRQQFRKDVVVDMFCYRRHGHNEGDEPAFTQPLMYKRIRDHKTTRTLYAEQLAAEGLVSAEESEQLVQEFHQRLEQDFEASVSYRPNRADWLEGRWAGLELAPDDDRRGNTAIVPELLHEVGRALTTVPDGFDLNSKIVRQLKQKADMIGGREPFDWATAEALAFGTLVAEGIPVRFSGQDVGRGTFSQRHAILYDQTSEARYLPLQHVRDGQAQFEIIDSPLSEAGVLGFEYGYSLAEPHALVLWEAQFGDFVNGAQVIIDQFISSGETKWHRMSGLVLLLPHGYEGQGPEHSSARLERFLQQSAEDNWQVANITTPANYFHALRRQVRRNFRKPLVLMTPKSLLRHKLCVSTFDDFVGETTFHRVLGESAALPDPQAVRRVVLCSGKVYFDLLQERDSRGIDDIALVRVEQLYPFPRRSLAAELGKYPSAEVVWCQEEPMNMGAWWYIDRRLESVLTELEIKAQRPSYVGRLEAAATATGSLRRHNQEQAKLIDAALTIA